MLKIPSQIKWLSWASFASDVSAEMTFPLLPLFMANVLGMTTGQIGLVEGVGLSTVALLKVFAGYFSDKFRARKPFIWIGYGIPTITKPILALATNWWHVLIYRFLDRTGKGIRDAPRDALIAASGAQSVRGRFFGFHRMFDTLGAIVGVVIATLILLRLPGSYRLVFWLAMIPIAIATLIVYAFVKEKKPVAVHHFSFSLKRMRWQYKTFLVVAFLFGLASTSYSFLLLQAQSLGVLVALIPLIYLVYNLTYAGFSYPAGVLSDRIGRKKVLLLGYLAFALVAFGFGSAQTPVIPWVLMALYGFAIALTDGVGAAFVSDLVKPEQRATGIGLYHAVLGIAILPANVLFGIVSEAMSAKAAFYLMGMFALAAAVVLFVFVRQKRIKLIR